MGPAAARTVGTARPDSGQVRRRLLSLERTIGEKWLAWVGSLVFAAGFGLLLKYAFEQGWLNEWARTGLGFAAGLFFLLLSELLYRKSYRVLAQGVAGVGSIILYLTVFIAHRFYLFFDTPEASLLFVAVSITGMALAVLHDSYAAALLTVLGAFATPVLLFSSISYLYYYGPAFFSYLLFIDLGVLYVSVVRRWRALFLLAFFGTTGYLGLWYLQKYTGADFRVAILFSILYFILFSFTATLYSLWRRGRSFREDLAFVILNPVFFFIFWYGLLSRQGLDWLLPLVPLAMAAFHYLLARIVRLRNPEDRLLYFALAGTATGLLTLPVPIWIKDSWMTPAWGVEAVILVAVGSFFNRRFLRIGGLAILCLVGYRLALIDPFAARSAGFTAGFIARPFLNLRFLPQLIAAACFGLAAFAFKNLPGLPDGERKFCGRLWLAFAVFLFWIANLELFGYFSRLGAFAESMKWPFSTILWSLFAWWLFFAGMLRRNGRLFKAGLGLAAATVLKVMLLDTPLLRGQGHGYPFLLNLRFLAPAFLLGALATAAFFHARLGDGERPGGRRALPWLWTFFTALLFWVLNAEVFAFFGQVELNAFPESLIFTDILWAVFALVLVRQGLRNGVSALRTAGLLLLVAAFVKAILADLFDGYGLFLSGGDPLLFNLKFLGAAAMLVVAAHLASLYAEPGEGRTYFERPAVPCLWILFLVLLFVELNLQSRLLLQGIWDLERQRFALVLSLLWFLYGFGLLLAGIVKESLPLRFSALTLFGVTLLKVFFVDLNFIGKAYRTAALLAIGSLLLIGAYLYRRYRQRISERE